MAVLAVQAIGRLRGGAQSKLMMGADGKLWVVKFQNNPQGMRVLANEWMATRLAEAIGLPVPKTDVVEVTEWLVANTPELYVEPRAGVRERCRAGLQFGCEYVGVGDGAGRAALPVMDYLPEVQLGEVKNLGTFAGVLALDKWTGNCNGRQAVFVRKGRERGFRAVFIDQGFCFGADGWTFLDSPKRGVYGRNRVYAGVTGWESFEPWLSRIEKLAPETAWRIAEAMPPGWYEGDAFALERLIEELLARRGQVRERIEEFRESDRMPFPAWRSRVSTAVDGAWPARLM